MDPSLEAHSMLAPMGYIATTQALVGVPHDAHDSPTSVLDPAFGGETSIPIVYRPSKSPCLELRGDHRNTVSFLSPHHQSGSGYIAYKPMRTTAFS